MVIISRYATNTWLGILHSIQTRISLRTTKYNQFRRAHSLVFAVDKLRLIGIGPSTHSSGFTTRQMSDMKNSIASYSDRQYGVGFKAMPQY